MVFFTQSMRGFFSVSQGMPRTIWAHPRLTIIRHRSLSNVVAWQWTLVAAVIHPCLFGVLLMLRAWRGSIDWDGRRRWLTREGSMKFPVAPQSTRVVVTMVLAPYRKRMGKWIALSDWFATSTDAIIEEEDIVATLCSKKTLHLFHRLWLLIGEVVITHWVSFLFLLTLLHISPDLIHWRWQWM